MLAIKEGLSAAQAATHYEGQLLELSSAVLPRNADGLPVLDCVLLGVGPDGHVASLFPNRRETAATGEDGRRRPQAGPYCCGCCCCLHAPVGEQPARQWACCSLLRRPAALPPPPQPAGGWVLPVTESPKPPAERITLTMPVLNAAANVAVVALGQARCPVPSPPSSLPPCWRCPCWVPLLLAEPLAEPGHRLDAHPSFCARLLTNLQGKAEVVQRALEVQSLPGALPVQLVQPPAGERRACKSWCCCSAAAGAVRALFHERPPRSPRLPFPPCLSLCSTGKLTWFLDQASASALSPDEWALGSKRWPRSQNPEA